MTGTDRTEQLETRHRRMTAVLAVLVALAVGVPVLSGATFTSGSGSTGRIGAAADWAPPMVELADPGDAIRGTVTLTATASDTGTGVASVSIGWAPADSTTFTTLCTKTAAPYTCTFATASLPDDEVDLRAVATDRSGYTATDLIEGVLIDNTAPSGSLGTFPAVLTGVVTIPATATDAGSGVASVTIQRSTAGLNTWTTICTDVDLPYSCRFDTTVLLTGLYDFRAIVTDLAGNTATTATVKNRLLDNTADSVSIDDPGAFLRGTVTIGASAASKVGVASVKVQRQAAGSTTWVDLCTDTSTPYGCSWVTTTVADGQYSFRAILTNSLLITTTSATFGPVLVDNTPVRGYDVQTTNADTAGRIKAGDTVSVTYTRTMAPGSILAGWDGSARAVTLRARDGSLLGLTNNDDTLDVSTSTALSTPVNLGSINLKANYVRQKKTVGFAATMVMTTVTVNGAPASKVTLTIGAVTIGAANTTRTAGGKPVMVWTPSAVALDTTGLPASTAPTSELGTADLDF